MFREYMHLEKFGNTEVEGIELGISHIFPKIDGTNASAWLEAIENGPLGWCGGSRTRELSLASDNAGFYTWLTGVGDQQDRLYMCLVQHPKWRLYGEWLVPHTFQGYRPDAWRKFYVFDVYNDETDEYLPYSVYQPELQKYGVEYIAPLAIVKNADYELFQKYLKENFFLCPDGAKDPGEGIVIKNYDYYNKFGRQCWAKIIRQEFKEQHYKAMGAPEVNNSMMNEERIVLKAVDMHLVNKTVDKIRLEHEGWSSTNIPELLNRVYYDVVKEELWDCLKEINFGTVNFKTLKALVIQRIKQLRPEIFS